MGLPVKNLTPSLHPMTSNGIRQMSSTEGSCAMALLMIGRPSAEPAKQKSLRPENHQPGELQQDDKVPRVLISD